uniref:Uncharacterized protein n=1 Tax=Vespula pensylvanica TaxID=30213 RepID=A0A834N6P4_VESPE|nr:hypothetical protein H0235_016230 [Vespula pensylvanica]
MEGFRVKVRLTTQTETEDVDEDEDEDENEFLYSSINGNDEERRGLVEGSRTKSCIGYELIRLLLRAVPQLKQQHQRQKLQPPATATGAGR